MRTALNDILKTTNDPRHERVTHRPFGETRLENHVTNSKLQQCTVQSLKQLAELIDS